MNIDNKRYIAGGLSGIVEVLFTHPVDYIKTQKQIFIQNKLKISFWKYVTSNSFYSGVIPRIAGVAPMRFVFWGVQDSSYTYTKNTLGYSHFYSGLIAGTVGGSTQTLIDNPIEIIKIKLINKQRPQIKDFVNQYGFIPTLMRNIGFAICVSSICFDNKNASNMDKFLYSSGAGLLGSIITHPFDYIKTYQQQNSCFNTYGIIETNLKENPLNFFSGLTGRMLLSSLTMGIGFVAYENIFNIINLY